LRKPGISLFAWAMALIVVAGSRLCRLADPYAIPPGVKSGSAPADLEASSTILEGDDTSAIYHDLTGVLTKKPRTSLGLAPPW
jgi:hypothetical protein